MTRTDVFRQAERQADGLARATCAKAPCLAQRKASCWCVGGTRGVEGVPGSLGGRHDAEERSGYDGAGGTCVKRSFGSAGGAQDQDRK